MSVPPWREPPAGFRRHRPNGFGCLFLGLFVLVGWPLVWIAAVAGTTAFRTRGPHPGFLVVLVVFVVLLLVGRFLSRFARTLDELADAARRVEGGDLEARGPDPATVPWRLRDLVVSFRTMVGRLAEDERQRRRLLADVSHELRTPLAVVQGSVEAMLDGIHPADEEHLRGVLAETQVLSRLVDDVRTVALSESGTLPLHREPTDLGVLAGELEAAFRDRFVAAGGSLDVSIPADLPLLAVDPVRTREVLANLVANALEHGRRGVAVRISAATVPTSETVRIDVSDDGGGIPSELVPTLFDRFVKSPTSRGSGLGLAIARNLVVAQGGTIEIANAPGRGTTFTIHLPSARPEP